MGGGNSYDGATDITIDASGNVYVTGTSTNSGMWDEYATIKYSPGGIEKWVAHYSGPDNGSDNAKAITIDPSGDIIVTGESYSSATLSDYATIKYNSEGVQQWATRYHGTGDGFDRAYSITHDSAGNVYVTGYSDNSETGIDYTTIKYDSDGREQWVAAYNGRGSYQDQATDIAIDNTGNVYITGFSGSSGARIYSTIKYHQTTVSINNTQINVPEVYLLLQNYPNPFNPVTTIRYSLPNRGKVVLSVYNLLGKEVVRLVDKEQNSGYHNVKWVASSVASGIYFYRLQAGDFLQTRKMLLLK